MLAHEGFLRVPKQVPVSTDQRHNLESHLCVSTFYYQLKLRTTEAMVSKKHIIVFLLYNFYFHVSSASSITCSFKEGFIPSTNFTLCSPNGSYTHCCPIDSTCLSSGLCLAPRSLSFTTGGCTDPTWNDPACFQHCENFSEVYRCSGGTFCCSTGMNSTSCCNNRHTKFFNITNSSFITNSTALAPGLAITNTDNVSTNNTTCTDLQKTLDDWAVHRTDALVTGLGLGVPMLIMIAALSYLLHLERKRATDLARKLGCEPPPLFDWQPLSPLTPLSARSLYQSGYEQLREESAHGPHLQIPSRASTPLPQLQPNH